MHGHPMNRDEPSNNEVFLSLRRIEKGSGGLIMQLLALVPTADPPARSDRLEIPVFNAGAAGLSIFHFEANRHPGRWCSRCG